MAIRLKHYLLLSLFFLIIPYPALLMGQETREEGWSIPDLEGLIPYSITIRSSDGVEKMVEKFSTTSGRHVARISGNGRVYAYAVDHNEKPPIDYLILDPNGSGRFTHKYGPDDFFLIPEWVSRQPDHPNDQ
jgi:hypothetical protein